MLALLSGSASAASDVVQEWIRDHAKPVLVADGAVDASLVAQIAGEARIVSLGEAVHLTQEFLQLRNQLFVTLVERQGFTAFAMETGFLDGIEVDDYIGAEAASVDAPVQRVFSFNDAAIDANRELIEWMRAYNEQPGTRRKLRFYGLSMTGRSGRDERARSRTIVGVLRYLQSVDQPLAESFRTRLEPLSSATRQRRSDVTSRAQQDALSALLLDVVSVMQRRRVQWQSRTSRLAFDRAYQMALNALQVDADQRLTDLVDARADASIDYDQNDAALAANLQWALAQEGPDGRIFAFAHNAHVRRCPERAEYNFTAMGQHVDAVLGRDQVVIGTSFHHGEAGLPGHAQILAAARPGTLADALSVTGKPLYALSLQHLPVSGPVLGWWEGPMDFRRNGAYSQLEPAACFDALIHVDALTPARLVPRQ